MAESNDRVAIISHFTDAEGDRGVAFGGARVDCPRCEELGGWDGRDTGLGCPYGCGVRVFSTQKEEDARWRAEEHVREQIRRDARTLRKAARAAEGKRP